MTRESDFSSTYPNLKEIEPKIGGKKTPNGVEEYEKDVVQSYLVIFWCCQYCKAKILICLFNIFLGQRSIFISMCLACIFKKKKKKKKNWKGHVVMPEMVDGSYHLTNFYAVWNAHSIILSPNWCSLFKVIDLVTNWNYFINWGSDLIYFFCCFSFLFLVR